MRFRVSKRPGARRRLCLFEARLGQCGIGHVGLLGYRAGEYVFILNIRVQTTLNLNRRLHKRQFLVVVLRVHQKAETHLLEMAHAGCILSGLLCAGNRQKRDGSSEYKRPGASGLNLGTRNPLLLVIVAGTGAVYSSLAYCDYDINSRAVAAKVESAAGFEHCYFEESCRKVRKLRQMREEPMISRSV